MELEVGRAYLCEVWLVPPEFECNGEGPRLEVMRFAGMFRGSGRVRTRQCGDVLLEVRENEMMESWEVSGASDLAAGVLGWRIVPLRVLAPETAAPVEETA